MASINLRILKALESFLNVRHACLRSSSSRHLSVTTTCCHQNVLYGAVCVRRLPVITVPMNDIEKRYSDLLSKLEHEKSHLSDFEIRLSTEAKSAKKSKDGDDVEGEVETALDLLDKWDAEMKNFVPAPRETEADVNDDRRSLERKLDSSLYLLVKQNVEGNYHWVLPQALWEQGETLRETAEKALSTLCGNVKATFLGNAPCAVAKFEPKVKEGDKKVKLFFFQAWYREGDVIPNKTEATDYLWVARDELPKYCHGSYQKQLKKFILDL
uniref:Large ribosomal subunit protein mL46 n=1 Tax=Arion vulgaris TaxID=1028688 RepID=A0A0B6ZUH7_9EUPU